jgi:hypothetical protein
MCGGKLYLRHDRRQRADHRIFERLALEFYNKKISEGLFVLEWAMEQKRQGITPAAWDRDRYYRMGGRHAL